MEKKKAIIRPASSGQKGRKNLPGKRCMKTLTILSKELKTKLHLHTISAQASGPCSWIYHSQEINQTWNIYQYETKMLLNK
jgi:hypothetical protein